MTHHGHPQSPYPWKKEKNKRTLSQWPPRMVRGGAHGPCGPAIRKPDRTGWLDRFAREPLSKLVLNMLKPVLNFKSETTGQTRRLSHIVEPDGSRLDQIFAWKNQKIPRSIIYVSTHPSWIRYLQHSYNTLHCFFLCSGDGLWVPWNQIDALKIDALKREKNQVSASFFESQCSVAAAWRVRERVNGIMKWELPQP